ncbi:MAG: transcription termination factor NusA [Opitutales bacterium]|nr:transcription termination factor NusA [Opitutales bacterium]
MSSEILSVLEYMEKEKGIDRKDMIAAITAAIKNAAQKGLHAGQELRIEINERNGALKAWSRLNVVDSVSNPETEIHLMKARELNPAAQLGDLLEKEVDPSFLGRIAAQTARQAIMQRIRQFEKERIFDDYKDQVGDIVSGIVRRRERDCLIVDLGKAEALLPYRERIPGEDYQPGERIRCLLLRIENTPKGPELILSRSSIKFVRRLLDLEVTEIADGTVTVEGMAREPGYRTKIAVNSNDPKVDPVGACVGSRGARVKSVVRELGGEKIDIIRFYEDPHKMLEEALRPAVPRNIEVNADKRRIFFRVSEGDIRVTLGKGGINAKLTSKLMGWKLDIEKLESSGPRDFKDQVSSAASEISSRLGIEMELARRLVESGFNSLAIFEGVTAEDLMEADFAPADAERIIQKLAERDTAAQ